MAKEKKNEKQQLINVYNRIYSPSAVLNGAPRRKTKRHLAKAKTHKARIDALKGALGRNPCDYEALLKLKEEMFRYKAFYVRQKKRLKGKKSKPPELMAVLSSISLSGITELIARSELMRYNRYFSERPSLERPSVAEVLKTVGAVNMLKTKTLLDVYNTLYVTENIKLKIEKALLENPKELYPAARAVKRKFIIHSGTTNTGKTYNAVEALKKAETGAYLGPLRLLALEIQENLLMDDVMCSLITGEEEDIVRYATHVSSTVEMVDLYAFYDVVVIDECQMIGNKHRGSAWTRAVLGVRAGEIHLCTAPDAVGILVKIIEDCGDDYEIINYERRAPIMYDETLDTGAVLSWENREGRFVKPGCAERLRKINVEKLCYGDALIAFSRSDVLEIADILKERGINASVIYGSLPYSARKKQLESFLRRETEIIVATDAIGMGLNLPIRRVIFTVAHKFDGENYRLLYPSEIKQIAGRAGRIGIFDEGFVYSVEMPEYIKSAVNAQIAPVEKAHIDFDAAFVEIEYGLEEILRAWTAAELPFDIYEKINLDRTIALLRSIDRLCEEKNLSCGKETAYRLANIVFDESVPQVYGKWLDYTEYYLNGGNKLPLPPVGGRSLEKLETAFKKVDLYYSFCRSMGYEPDMEWIRAAKSRIAEEINRKLRMSR